MNWLKYPDYFNKLVESLDNDPGVEPIVGRKKDKKINLNKARMFVEKILHWKIDSINAAEEEFLIEIKEDKDYLDKKSTTSESVEKIKNVLNELEYAVFGIDTPKEKSTEDTDSTEDNKQENNDIREPPPLEIEAEAAQRQEGQVLKILTPQQMITRLPILLAQLKAGNNLKKLKNEIR